MSAMKTIPCNITYLRRRNHNRTVRLALDCISVLLADDESPSGGVRGHIGLLNQIQKCRLSATVAYSDKVFDANLMVVTRQHKTRVCR